MATTFKLKRKLFGEYGEAALKALREGKAAGLVGKELQDWVKLNSGSTYATQSGIKSIGGIQSRPAVGQQMKVTAPNNTFTAATPNTGVTTGGNMVSLTGAPSKSTKINKKPINITADQAFGNVTKKQNTIITNQANRTAQRTANKANAGGVAAAAKRARTQGYNAGYNKAANTIGIGQGMRNTWNNMGTMSKVGTVAAGATVAGLALKGLFGGKKKRKDED